MHIEIKRYSNEDFLWKIISIEEAVNEYCTHFRLETELERERVMKSLKNGKWLKAGLTSYERADPLNILVWDKKTNMFSLLTRNEAVYEIYQQWESEINYDEHGIDLEFDNTIFTSHEPPIDINDIDDQLMEGEMIETKCAFFWHIPDYLNICFR